MSKWPLQYKITNPIQNLDICVLLRFIFWNLISMVMVLRDFQDIRKQRQNGLELGPSQ